MSAKEMEELAAVRVLADKSLLGFLLEEEALESYDIDPDDGFAYSDDGEASTDEDNGEDIETQTTAPSNNGTDDSGTDDGTPPANQEGVVPVAPPFVRVEIPEDVKKFVSEKAESQRKNKTIAGAPPAGGKQSRVPIPPKKPVQPTKAHRHRA